MGRPCNGSESAFEIVEEHIVVESVQPGRRETGYRSLTQGSQASQSEIGETFVPGSDPVWVGCILGGFAIAIERVVGFKRYGDVGLRKDKRRPRSRQWQPFREIGRARLPTPGHNLMGLAGGVADKGQLVVFWHSSIESKALQGGFAVAVHISRVALEAIDVEDHQFVTAWR